jgi:hypothetical protein
VLPLVSDQTGSLDRPLEKAEATCCLSPPKRRDKVNHALEAVMSPLGLTQGGFYRHFASKGVRFRPKRAITFPIRQRLNQFANG